MPSRPRSLSRLLRAQAGFTGAERALLICFGLAIVVAAGGLLSAGSKQAGQDASRTLAAGTGAVGQASPAGQTITPSGLPRAQPIEANIAPPASVGELAAVSAPGPARALAAVAEPTPIAEGQADTAYDGAYVGAGGRAYPATTPISQVPPVRPRDGRTPNETIIYVNGIQTDKAGQSGSLQDIADRTGAQVIGIHNATEGFWRDLAQCVQDKADMGTNPAVDTLADTVYAAIQQGKPIHIMGHSQGGLIVSRALTHVRQRLIIEDGLTPAEAEQRMGLIQAETFGAAAVTYPNGPQYVHYINVNDPVPSWFGLGDTGLGNWGAGRGAQVIRFSDWHLNPIASHSFDDVYLPRRQPFAQARGR